jgi:hypothetical protein
MAACSEVDASPLFREHLDIEAALAAVRINHMHLPEAFGWVSNGQRGGLEQEQLSSQWSGMALERRIGLAAMLVGGPSFSPPCNAVLAKAYLALCRGGVIPGRTGPEGRA